MQKENNNQNNGVLIIVLLSVVAVLVLFFPRIYEFINNLSVPEVENIDIEEEEEIKEIDESVLEMIHYPMMRTSIYNSNTYYSLDKFTIKDLSNNDILLNAFLDIEEIDIEDNYEYVPCTNISKQFTKEYLELRIKNILGIKTKYTLDNFYVPEDSKSSYVGNWYYDTINNRFIYNGLCISQATNTRYYDLEQLIKIEYEGKDIVSHYYVGFAKVEGNNYIIYKDAKMTNELTNGVLNNIEELDNIFKEIDNKNKQIYQYRFKNNLCTYNEYCLYEGKWVDEF